MDTGVLVLDLTQGDRTAVGDDTINAHIFRALDRFAKQTVQIHRERSWTFDEAAQAIHGVAIRLRTLGVEAGHRVAILGENSPRWIHAFLGIQALGAVAVPRGLDTPADELRYILEHSGSRVAFVGDEATARQLPPGSPMIALYDRKPADTSEDPMQPPEVQDFPAPQEFPASVLDDYATVAAPGDLAVILYTSGTTGRPKGVMLEHRNIAHNLRTMPPMVRMEMGDCFLSILPPWHTFELTVELGSMAVGCCTIYSDKRRLRDDLRQHRPQYFASVPRIWETVHDAARAAVDRRGSLARLLFSLCYKSSQRWRRGNAAGWPLHCLGRRLFYRRMAEATGGRLKFAVSGGGALPAHVDEFFAIVGVPLLVGYGLTETSPVVAVRRPDDNVLGTIGRSLPETEIRVGQQGTFLVRGPQVMRGYYKDDDLTRQVISEDGWFDTGDLGKITPRGDLVFLGRLKETIVLLGGENIEPEPIENSLQRSPLIEQVVLVGQDRKTLGALVVPAAGSLADRDTILAELQRLSGPRAGFRSFETVRLCALVDEPFAIANGLMTATLKLRRNAIASRYEELIQALYA